MPGEAMNPALLNTDRNQRRLLLKEEARRRASGDWGEWEMFRFPRGTVGPRSWVAEFDHAYKNRVFCVLDRRVELNEVAAARHLAISSLSQIRPTWHEMQRIKDEIAGEAATAVEVYPPKNEIVDDADMFHLWVLPEALPFGLYERQCGNSTRK
jgi:hypothetical protein